MNTLEHILNQYWGYSEFRPLQQEAMESVLSGQDSLVVMPTGGGKSLCYQAPALAMNGLAVIVSPLISLMKDQVDFLRTCGVNAACINSTINDSEKRAIDQDIQNGQLKLLYVAPERLTMDSFIHYLKKIQISFFAIDEAHCISHWGHDFRPHYRQMNMLKETFAGIPIHAYTATATGHVRDDICLQLGLEKPAVYVGDFDRPNLLYSVERQRDRNLQVLEVVERNEKEAGIVYCSSRKKVEDMAQFLVDEGHAALPYHAGMDDYARKSNQDAFARDETNIIVATVAFGMGIDKSNVRFVVHAGMPKSLEHYQQESGRAGRDGLEAECCLIYSKSDLVFWKRLLAELDDEVYSAAVGKLNDIFAYCTNIACRHKKLVEYFGQNFLKKSCDACDVCQGNVECLDDSAAISIMILECVEVLGPVAGGAYTAAVLSGSSEKRVMDKGHNALPSYGALSNYSTADIRDWIEQLAGQGFLSKEGEYNILATTAKAKGMESGKEIPRLLKPEPPKRKKKKMPEKTWEGVDRDLFEALRVKRLELAQQRSVPAYVVFGDVTLRDMATKQPRTLDALLDVQGIGEKKCHDFGDTFLKVIDTYLSVGPAEAGEPVVGQQYASDFNPRQRTSKEDKQEEKIGRVFKLYSEGLRPSDVAAQTGLSASKAMKMLGTYLMQNEVVDPSPWVSEDASRLVAEAVSVVGSARVKAIYEYVDGTVDTDSINIALACLRNADLRAANEAEY